MKTRPKHIHSEESGKLFLKDSLHVFLNLILLTYRIIEIKRQYDKSIERCIFPNFILTFTSIYFLFFFLLWCVISLQKYKENK